MSLEDFMVFDDGVDVKKPLVKKPIVKKPTPKVNKQKQIIEEIEEPIVISKGDRTSTIDALDKRFEGRKKIDKESYNNVYKGKKTILGSLIKSTDKIVLVLLIDGANATSNKFVSVSPRIVAEREVGLVASEYMSINNSRRDLALVELKYMYGVNYHEHRQKIIDQYL